MNDPRRSIDLFYGQQNGYESKPEARTAHPLLSQNQSTINNSSITTKLLMVWPLVIHFIGSVAIAATVASLLNGRQYYLERQPQVKLADETYESKHLGRYNLLQSDIVTILSGSLMILRWIAAAWAVPLCWRAIFLLAERNGLRRRDIEWVVNYGVLPLTTLFRRHLNLFVGIILLFTLTPFPVSLLLTGSISWLPSNVTMDLPYQPIINLTGIPLDPNTNISARASDIYGATLSTAATKNFNMAWGQAAGEQVIRRVVPSVAQLNIGSTVENVIMPSFAVTKLEWRSALEDNTSQLLQTMLRDQDNFRDLSYQMHQPGAAALIIKYAPEPNNQGSIQFLPPKAWSMLINVGTKPYLTDENCNSSTTILPENSTTPYFYHNTEPIVSNASLAPTLFGCFAYATVSYNAAYGLCRDCRVVSYSTVENETSLEALQHNYGVTLSVDLALRRMPQYIPSATPLKDFLPDPARDLEAYATTFLIRLYSALWNSLEDSVGTEPGASSGYKPAVQVLKAEVSYARVYAWLALQLSLTFAGLIFIWLQSGSQYPLITNTRMVAFDIDSTEITKPNSSSEKDHDELLRIEPKGDGWKVVVVD